MVCSYRLWRVSGGFTLVEMAVMLIIIGLMTGYGLHAFDSDNGDQCAQNSTRTLQELQDALNRFVAAQGRLPMPAGRSYSTSDPYFGQEVGSPTSAAIDRLVGPPAVLIGAFPVTTLGLSPDRAIDCWGNKFTYAVTEALTNAASYADSAVQGGIEIRYGPLGAYQMLTNKAAYTLISHGEDALGASKANYKGPKRNCNVEEANPVVTRIDKENCDTLNSMFYSAEFNRGTRSADFFDDLLIYAEKKPVLPPAAPSPSSPSPSPSPAPSANDCAGGLVTWGGNCAAPALLTLAGLDVTLTNINSGYTGVAVSTCNNGSRTTIGACLPVGACSTTSPRGGPLLLLTGISMNFGTGVCKRYSCCSGSVTITNISPCLLPADLPGIASCP